MNYDDLVKAHKSKELMYDKTYADIILPIQDVWKELDSVIDFVRRWNTRVPIGRNKEQIKQAVLKEKKRLQRLEGFHLDDFDFSEEHVALIKELFRALSQTALKSTGTTKLLHGMNPRLFMMWDSGIRKAYDCPSNEDGYVLFLQLMQKAAKKILEEKPRDDIEKELGRTLPKLIDEYNWMHFKPSA